MKRTIVSGYFNPIHLGHLNYIKDAKKRGDYLIVIVNNDEQQILKKGHIIMEETERFAIVEAIRYVDEVMLSIDTDKSVCESLRKLVGKYPEDEIYFCNGGDRPNLDDIPESSVEGLKFEFGVGGGKQNSSSDIIGKMKKV